MVRSPGRGTVAKQSTDPVGPHGLEREHNCQRGEDNDSRDRHGRFSSISLKRSLAESGDCDRSCPSTNLRLVLAIRHQVQPSTTASREPCRSLASPIRAATESAAGSNFLSWYRDSRARSSPFARPKHWSSVGGGRNLTIGTLSARGDSIGPLTFHFARIVMGRLLETPFSTPSRFRTRDDHAAAPCPLRVPASSSAQMRPPRATV